MNAPRAPFTRSAFTLVELLTVVAIVGVLAGIVIAALGGARRRAQDAACKSNLRQIGAATLLYASDHKGMLPPAHLASVTWPMRTWMYLIQPYAEDRKVSVTAHEPNVALCYDGLFRCPSKADWALVGSGVTDLERTSYGMNTFMPEGLPAGQTELSIRILSTFTRPSDTMLVSDYNSTDYRINNRSYLYGTEVNRLSLRHSDRHNVVMVDGHVESLPVNGLNYYLVKSSVGGALPF